MKDFLKKYKKVYMALIIIVVAFPAVILLKSPIGIIPRNIGVEIINWRKYYRRIYRFSWNIYNIRI